MRGETITEKRGQERRIREGKRGEERRGKDGWVRGRAREKGNWKSMNLWRG